MMRRLSQLCCKYYRVTGQRVVVVSHGRGNYVVRVGSFPYLWCHHCCSVRACEEFLNSLFGGRYA